MSLDLVDVLLHDVSGLLQLDRVYDTVDMCVSCSSLSWELKTLKSTVSTCCSGADQLHHVAVSAATASR